jgi:RNA polymerase primary sigma factor
MKGFVGVKRRGRFLAYNVADFLGLNGSAPASIDELTGFIECATTESQMKANISSDREEGLQDESPTSSRLENITLAYLKEMQKISLLTREREIELAKTIRKGEDTICDLILKFPQARRELASLGEKVEEGSIKPREIVQAKEDHIRRIIKRLEDTVEEEKHSNPAKGEMLETLRRINRAESEVDAAKKEMRPKRR